MPFLSKTLTYGVFGPIILDYAPGEFFCWHFYARRRGRILIMPDADGDGKELPHYFHHIRTRLKSALKTFFSSSPRPILLAVRRWWGQPGISGIPKQSQGRSYLLFWRRAFVEESGAGAGVGRTIQTDWIGRFFPTVLHSCILVA